MLSWRSAAALGALVMVTAGCESAHIKDVYISRDEDGIRRTSCIQPQWQEYFLLIELLSFKDDTLVWPYLYCLRGGCEALPQSGNGVIAPPWIEGEEQLVKFGNIAPGKTGENVSKLGIKFTEVEVNPETGQVTIRDLTPGSYQWRIFIDDEEEPRESLLMDVHSDCPCIDTAIGNGC